MIKRRGNYIATVVVLCLFIVINQAACTAVLTEEQKKEQAEIKRRIQLAAVDGKQGYLVLTTLIGRIKTTLLTENPVQVEVVKIPPELIEKPINFAVVDSTGYELMYKTGEEVKRLRGYFGQPLKTDGFELMISGKNIGKQESDSLKYLRFELKIYKY